MLTLRNIYALAHNPLSNIFFPCSGDNPEEWEAELEGELNEFEVVNGSGNGGKAGEANPEWESQIEEMLEAEEQEQQAKK